MKIELKDNQAIVSHGKERLIFDLRDIFQSQHRSISRNPFREINMWFETLPENRQLAIFKIYETFRKELTTNSHAEFLMDRMGQLAEALYKYIDPVAIREFIEANRLITIPREGFETQHNPNDPNPEKTYIAIEYYNLMLYIVCLRPLFPVSSEFMVKLAKVYGKDYKEHYARISLITNTWLSQAPELKRLIEYIEASVAPKKDQISNIVFNAMSKEDFPEWVASKVICRRLMSGEVHILPGVPNQIASIWSFIDNSVRQTPKIPSAGDVVLKSPLSESGDDHKSMADENRVRQNTTIGYLVRHETYFSNIGKVIHQIDPTVPVELIAGAKENPLKFGIDCISRWHTVISQIVVADKVSVRVLEALNKPVHVSAAEIARVLLWHWGHKELSLLISAEDQPIDLTGDELVIGAPVRIHGDADEALIERIAVIYKLDDGQRRIKPKSHPVYTDLKDLALLIPSRLWDVKPIKGVELPDYVDSTLKMKTPNAIINLVTKFAVELAEKRLLESEI
jgi:hypothetical protein